MRVIETIQAEGHPNITAKNKTTFEVTKKTHLTKRGDCIIAVNASKGTKDLSDAFKQTATRDNAKITVTIVVGDHREISTGRGNQQLTLSHPTDLVARKSSYTSDRTLMIEMDKAAADFPRSFIKELQDPSQKITITIIAET